MVRDEEGSIERRKEKGKGLGGEKGVGREKLSGLNSLIVALTEQVALEQIQAVVEEVQ